MLTCMISDYQLEKRGKRTKLCSSTWSHQELQARGFIVHAIRCFTPIGQYFTYFSKERSSFCCCDAISPRYKGHNWTTTKNTRPALSSIPTIIPELRQYSINQPSDHEVYMYNFKANVYNLYLIVYSCHITTIFLTRIFFNCFQL